MGHDQMRQEAMPARDITNEGALARMGALLDTGKERTDSVGQVQLQKELYLLLA